MNHRSLALLLLVAGATACAPAMSVPSTPAPIVNTRYTFADVTWGARGDSVTKTVARHGYRLRQVDEDGDYRYEGYLLGYPTVVFGLMSDRKVSKLTVVMVPGERRARTAYAAVKAELTKQYGEPDRLVETFEAPYREGDGREGDAFKKGKAHFVSLWRTNSESGARVIGLSITEAMLVSLEYESPTWERELARRQSKAKKKGKAQF